MLSGSDEYALGQPSLLPWKSRNSALGLLAVALLFEANISTEGSLLRAVVGSRIVCQRDLDVVPFWFGPLPITFLAYSETRKLLFLDKLTENYLNKPQKNEYMKGDDVCVCVHHMSSLRFLLTSDIHGDLFSAALRSPDGLWSVYEHACTHVYTYYNTRIIDGPGDYRRLVGGTKARRVSFL